MPSFEEFFEYVKNNIKTYMPEEYKGCNVEVARNIKENDIVLKGIQLKNESEETYAAPILYLQPYYTDYLNGEKLKKIMNEIAHDYISYEKQMKKLAHINFSCFDEIKDLIGYDIVNARFSRDYLETVVHTMEEDLAKVYQILLSDEESVMGMRIDENHLLKWGVSLEEINKIADANMVRRFPARFLPVLDVIMQRADLPEITSSNLEIPKERNLYYLSTSGEYMSAAVIFYPGVLEMVRDYIGEDFYILPCSTHEVQIISKNYADPKEYGEVVKKANKTVVPRNEVLSDCIYEFSMESKKIRVVPETIPQIQKRRGLER